jgi:hydrogenase nickel incorporation protein HypA/HybF
MHELSIALSLIEGVLEQAKKHGDVHIDAVHLKMGVFSGIDEDALQFSYRVACEGTPLHGSHLVIEQTPIIIYCRSCNAERSLPSLQPLTCPHCQAAANEVRGGRELEIAALEIVE